jgi:alcohol dehydrogenase (cytochrome c)
VRAGETVEVWPSPWGAKNWPHAAFNPETGLLYANTMHFAHTYRFIPAEFKPGQRYMGVENKRVPQVAGEPVAHVEAIDPLSAAPKWRVPIFDIPNYSAMLASAGGLLFTGKQTGEFQALDIDTGKTLWQFQTGSGLNAQPITFTHKGRQYVVVQSGLGGVNQARMAAELKNIPRGGSVWAFALMDQ